MIPQDSRSPFRQQRWVQCRNDSGQDLSPNSLVAVTGALRVSATGATILSIELPTSTTPVALLAATGLQTIKTGQDGHCTLDFPAYVKYSGGTPANGEQWGHEDGSDSLAPNKTGFRICGDQNGTVVRVMKESAAELVRFELTADLVLAGTATANLLDIEWSDTGTDITVRDPYTSPGCWQGYSGYRGFATMGANGIYDIVWMERMALIIYFTLTQNTNTSSGTTATVTSYFQQGDKDPGGTVLVYDVNSIYPRALSGAKGIAVWNDRTRRYEVLVCQQMGTLFWCDINSDFCPDASSTGITFGGRYQHSPFNQVPNPEPDTGQNFYALAGRANDKALLVFDDVNSTYDIAQVEPHLAEIPTEFRVVCDAMTKTAKLQMRGEKHYDYYCGELFDWKDVATEIGEFLENVIDVVWDGVSLKYTKEEQIVFCAFDQTVVTIDTTEECP